MKKSHVMLIVLVSIIFSMIAGLLIAGRIIAATAMKDIQTDNIGAAVKMYALTDFSRIEIDNSWKAEITQKDSYSIEVNAPEALEKYLSVEVRRDTLYLGYNTKNYHLSSKDTIAKISMPSLTYLAVDGFGDITVSGFHEELLEVIINGAADIYVLDSSARRVNVSLDGAGNIDLNGMPTIDANAEMDGAGRITLNMQGGVLTGYLDGAGIVRYTGEISSKQFEIDGMGNLQYFSIQPF